VPALQDHERGMNIVHFHPGPDTGGQSAGGKPILEAAGHHVRAFARQPHAFGYPPTELSSMMGGDPETEEAFEWADLVIVHNLPGLYARLARDRRKPLIIHHHGSRFRRDGALFWHYAAELGAVQVVSTVDLLVDAPGPVYWQPQNVDLAKMEAIRREVSRERPSGPIRVVQAPTNRHIKGTAMLQQQIRGTGLDLVLVPPNTKWDRCLQIKALGDIYADQFALGYGNNAIEAWAMGLPVVAGASEPILERMRAEYGRLPFLTSDASNLRANLLALAESADMRAEWAARGMEHVQRFHAPEAWLARFEEMAQLAMSNFAARAA
jgi:hypothetical protein